MLVQRGMDVDTGLARHPRRKAMRGAAGQRLGLDAGRLRPGGFDGEVTAQRQLLQTHQPRALARGERDRARKRGLMLVGVGMPALLHERHAQRCSTRRALAGGRGLHSRRDDQAYVLHVDDCSVAIEKSGKLLGYATITSDERHPHLHPARRRLPHAR